MPLLYSFLDWFLLIFHLILVIFNLFGWLWYKTLKLNLITLLLTGFSWFFLGIFYGWGYCPLTDWHWQVLHHLGKEQLPGSYMSYVIFRFTSWLPAQQLTDTLTLGFFLVALIISVYINVKAKKFRKTRS